MLAIAGARGTGMEPGYRVSRSLGHLDHLCRPGRWVTESPLHVTRCVILFFRNFTFRFNSSSFIKLYKQSSLTFVSYYKVGASTLVNMPLVPQQ
jgi:hypothetical protein